MYSTQHAFRNSSRCRLSAADNRHDTLVGADQIVSLAADRCRLWNATHRTSPNRQAVALAMLLGAHWGCWRASHIHCRHQ